MKLVVTLLLLTILSFVSCTPHRQMVYLQDVENLGNRLAITAPEYLLRPGDILNIRVLTLDRESRDLFNTTVAPGMTGGGNMPQVNFFITGYTIDSQGYIELPVAGKVQLEGLTLVEASDVIQKAIDQYLIDATVDVKLVNFTISVLGEVRNPGQFFIFDNKVSILDAIGMAGDLTVFGNRTITLVRRNTTGVTFHSVDITSRNFMTSDMFFLQPGDLIYVEPKPIKQLGFAEFPFGVLFSAISTTLVLINFLSR